MLIHIFSISNSKLFNNSIDIFRNSRTVPKIAIIVTDTRPTSNTQLTHENAASVRSAGVYLIVIVVSEDLDLDYFHQITGSADRIIKIKYHDEIVDSENIDKMMSSVKRCSEFRRYQYCINKFLLIVAQRFLL